MNNNNFIYQPGSNMPTHNGGDPFNRFRPMSTMHMGSMYANPMMSPTTTILPKMDYSNPGTLIHNNVGSSVLHEAINEYRVYVDSVDRDATSQPNPFSYHVSLRPTSGQYGPYISKDFNRVKYVRIDSITLPKYIIFTKNELVEARITEWSDDGDGEIDMFAMTYNSDNIITSATLDQWITDDNFADAPIDDSKRLAFIQQRLITTDQVNHIQAELADDLAAVQAGSKVIEDVYYKGIAYEDIIDRRTIKRVYAPTIDYDYYLDLTVNKWYIYTKNTSSSSLLYDDRYVMLVIDELANQQVYGTNKRLGEVFGLIYPSFEFNYHFYQGSTFQSSVIFPDSELRNLRRLTFRLYDVDGSPLVFNQLNSRDAYSVKDPRHPHHRHLQNQISIVVGEMDPSINKQPGYAQ